MVKLGMLSTLTFQAHVIDAGDVNYTEGMIQ